MFLISYYVYNINKRFKSFISKLLINNTRYLVNINIKLYITRLYDLNFVYKKYEDISPYTIILIIRIYIFYNYSPFWVTLPGRISLRGALIYTQKSRRINLHRRSVLAYILEKINSKVWFVSRTRALRMILEKSAT